MTFGQASRGHRSTDLSTLRIREPNILYGTYLQRWHEAIEVQFATLPEPGD